ncbi:MAG: glycoside hydrolase family 108 protein [Hyphomicrobiales bacterium]
MQDTFPDALKLVLAHEGGYVDHPLDPGGATNRGITIGTLRQWRGKPVTKSDVKNITFDEVAAIYRARYWDALSCDDLPRGLDYAVFDYGVNSGISRAARVLQALVGVTQDGIIGGMTLKAVSRCSSVTLINRLCDQRLSFLQRLRTWNAFGRGWTNRVRGVRNHALGMAGNG